MNDTPAKAKQQIVDKIKSSTNIMVTVSRDPSVDDLSAAIGMTAMLNKIGKHATAIFSGAIPPAITFLEPDKTFENTVDSLRDFIIALDKEKADHLRYKVEGDVVKIFITPYRTTITNDDLEFSQGDYNVELVLALGVENQEHLDTALAVHGQILHDVTVASLSAGSQVSRLGAIEWYEEGASCLSEMVTSLSDLLKVDAPILDKQIATALLTGIVAATDRFSNTKTSSAVMSLAAQLMAAGADQQLIASKLQESHQINSLTNNPSAGSDLVEETIAVDNNPVSTLPTGSLVVDHEPQPTVSEPPSVEPPMAPQNIMASSTLPPSDEPKIILDSKSNVLPDVPPAAPTGPVASTMPQQDINSLQTDDIMAHSYLGSPTSSVNAPINDDMKSSEDAKLIDIFNGDNSENKSTLPPAVTVNSQSQTMPASPDSLRDVDDNRAVVDSVLGSHPVAVSPVVDLPLPPPLPDFSNLTPTTPVAPDFNATVSSDVVPPVANDPTQFRIPG